MNPEPLKGKTIYTASVFKNVVFKNVEKEEGVNLVSKEIYESHKGSRFAMELFEKDKVKSAVEWLREKIQTELNKEFDGDLQNELDNWIEEAFEDVIK